MRFDPGVGEHDVPPDLRLLLARRTAQVRGSGAAAGSVAEQDQDAPHRDREVRRRLWRARSGAVAGWTLGSRPRSSRSGARIGGSTQVIPSRCGGPQQHTVELLTTGGSRTRRTFVPRLTQGTRPYWSSAKNALRFALANQLTTRGRRYGRSPRKQQSSGFVASRLESASSLSLPRFQARRVGAEEGS